MPKVFDGRIIFDHFPRTAGTAVNVWLTHRLGSRCVTRPLDGRHQDLIRRYGGEYSVISAHVAFEGDGLDPRYRYITGLREPVDRVISSLFFTVRNHSTDQIPELWEYANRFIISEGEDTDPNLLPWISNPYIDHFANILSISPRSEEKKLADALSAIEQYRVYGFYEDMPAFLSAVARLIGLPIPRQLDQVNVTKSRPSLAQLSPALRRRIETLNAPDLELYHELRRRWKRKHRRRTFIAFHRHSSWEPFAPASDALGPVKDATGTLESMAVMGSITTAEVVNFPVRLSNHSIQNWVATPLHPINLSYHWLDASGKSVVFNGERTPLPVEEVLAGQSIDTTVRVVAPTAPGSYQLVLVPVQEMICWFDERGFTPQILKIEIVASDAARYYPGADTRLLSQVGRREGTVMVSSGKEGLLIYGFHITLPAGRYTARMSGDYEPGTVEAWGDVCADQGGVVLAKSGVTAAKGGQLTAELSFELAKWVGDLEIRLWVPGDANVRVEALTIAPS